MEEIKPKNTRAFERFSSDMAIWARPIGEDENEFVLLEVCNISAGGILFKLDYQLKADLILDIRFELPQNNDLVEAKARVRHCMDKGEGLFHIGVQFVEVKNYPLQVLLAYLEALFK